MAERRRELAVFAKAAEGTRHTLDEIAGRVQSAFQEFISATEQDFLFDRERHLFAIGYNVTEGRRDPTYYDALASEARLASFIAIAIRTFRRNIGSSSAVS